MQSKLRLVKLAEFVRGQIYVSFVTALTMAKDHGHSYSEEFAQYASEHIAEAIDESRINEDTVFEIITKSMKPASEYYPGMTNNWVYTLLSIPEIVDIIDNNDCSED